MVALAATALVERLAGESSPKGRWSSGDDPTHSETELHGRNHIIEIDAESRILSEAA
jgi:hypothetical protein